MRGINIGFQGERGVNARKDRESGVFMEVCKVGWREITSWGRTVELQTPMTGITEVFGAIFE